MSDIVIKVENLSKQYRLGELGTGTLSHDLNRWWHKVRGQEDPYLKIGETNDRSTKGKSDYVWALRDINFEVKQGEVLGIIGKNGAGKSTLLKLLSRVTAPTTGSIKAKGRIASLLEVGTGFHEELTGRENIFLNGAILGMTKAEIRTKFDEIVAFSGTERYIDTPVKRYSSGMRVRLAFAVAAHLDPEILIVDEVLAVGDAEFQKKAIGKMQDVSRGQGRTVLFVSHNMASVKQLCTSGLIVNNGFVTFSGSINDVISTYQKTQLNVSKIAIDKMYRPSGYGIDARYCDAWLMNSELSNTQHLFFGEPFSIILEAKSNISNINNLNFGIRLETETEVYVASCLSGDTNLYFDILASDSIKLKVDFSDLKLVPGTYYVTLSIRRGKQFLDQIERAFHFTVDTITYQNTTPHNEAWGILQYYPNWQKL